MGIKSRGNELPNLVQYEWGRYKDTGHKCYLEVGHKSLRQVGKNQGLFIFWHNLEEWCYQEFKEEFCLSKRGNSENTDSHE